MCIPEEIVAPQNESKKKLQLAGHNRRKIVRGNCLLERSITNYNFPFHQADLLFTYFVMLSLVSFIFHVMQSLIKMTSSFTDFDQN